MTVYLPTHHEDECRSNNKHENLFEFSTSADHVMYHASGIKFENDDGSFTSQLKENIGLCQECNNPFDKVRNHRLFCSTDCSGKFIGYNRRTVERPSADLLKVQLKQGFATVGKLYGVSDNTIRKWCKSYDMSVHSKDYK